MDAKNELDETKSKSTTTLLATEDEILQLKAEWVLHLYHFRTHLFSYLAVVIFIFDVNSCVSVCVPHMSRWRFIRGSWMLLMTMSDRFSCWEMKCLTWTQRRPCCRRGAENTHININILDSSPQLPSLCISSFYHTWLKSRDYGNTWISLQGWIEYWTEQKSWVDGCLTNLSYGKTHLWL